MSKFVRIDDVAADERVPYFAALLPEELLSEGGLRLIGAVTDEGIPEGVVAFTVNENMVDIHYIEVYEKRRRQGIGTALIRTLLRYLAMSELPFVVQAIYSNDGDDEAKALHAFFMSMPDFEVVSGGKYCVVTPDVVWNSKRLTFVTRYECPATSYTELSNSQRNQLISDLTERGLSGLLLGGGGAMIPELSLCHLEEGHCTACTIFRESRRSKTIEFSFLMSMPHREEHLAGVLHAVLNRLRQSYGDYDIEFCLINRESELIAKNFFVSGMRVSKILTALSFGEV